MEGNKPRPALTPAQMKELFSFYHQDMTLEGERTQDPIPGQKLSDIKFAAIPGKIYIEGKTGKAVI